MIPPVQIPDFAGTISRGVQTRGMLAELADQQGIRDVLAQAGPGGLEGNPSVLSQLAGYGPRGIQLAQSIQQRGDQQRSALREQLPLIAGMLEGATPETWSEVRSRAMAAGISPSILPEVFDANRVAGVTRAAQAARQARADDAAATYNATLPGRMAVANAGRTSVNLRLPPMENSFAQRTGTSLAEEAGELAQGGRRAADTIRMVQRFERGLENFATGAAANTRQAIGQWAQQLGIPDNMLPAGVNRAATASAEEMRAITGQMLANMIGPGGFPAQNFSNADREMLERSLPNIASTPEGNRALLAASRAMAQRSLAVSQAWRTWQQQHGVSADSYLRFQRERMPQIVEQDILAPILGAVPAAPARATAPAGVPLPNSGGMTAEPPPPASGGWSIRPVR